MKKLYYLLFAFAFLLLPSNSWATVSVTNPFNGETVGTSASYAATAATSTCSKGVASMGIYVDGSLIYTVNGTMLNTTIPLTLGNHNTVVQEWDYCGGSTYTPIAVTVATQSAVWVTTPAPGSTVNMLTPYAATATSTCAKGVNAMGIYVNNQLVYTVAGAKLNYQLSLSPGAQHTVVQEWDNCGGSVYSTVNVNVANSGNKISNIQSLPGWQSWGQLPPVYADCSPCAGLNWSMKQGVSSPSLTGNATEFDTSGTTPYGVVLFYNPVMGQGSTAGLPDATQTLIPALHNFIYDTQFYVTDPTATQAAEFDVAMYLNGVGMQFEIQCNHLGKGEWDILDNVHGAWTPTTAPCVLLSGWNHLSFQVQRQTGNVLLYQTITMNGTIFNINQTMPPMAVPSTWYGITVNYQMDGNYKQTSNKTYLDNLNLTYW
jgi:hypothetical protein